MLKRKERGKKSSALNASLSSVTGDGEQGTPPECHVYLVRVEIVRLIDRGHLCNQIGQLRGPLQIDRTPARDIYEDLRVKNQRFGDFPKSDN